MLNMKIVSARSVRGKIQIPGDKSISHRAGLLAAMCEGTTRIENFATAADCHTTLSCLESLGVTIRVEDSAVIIDGIGKTGFRAPAGSLDCGNSGTTMRQLAGVLAGQHFDSVLIGDASLSKRPMMRIIEPLAAMGANIVSDDGHAPIHVNGGNRLNGIEHEMKIASAQIKSCILLAGLLANGRTTVIEHIPTRDHTERMLRWFGIDVAVKDDVDRKVISIEGDQMLTSRDLNIPGDISSGAYFMIAAACLPESSIEIENVGLNSTRSAIIDVLRRFGASITITNERVVCNEPVGDLKIAGQFESTKGPRNVLDGKIIANIIDEIPILAVFGTQINGGLEIRDAEELRVKESDRITATVENLRKMGAQVTEFADGFKVEKSDLKGARISSFGDHRIAMAFAVAGLFAAGKTEIAGATCADISFPGFFEILRSVVR